MVLLSRSMLLVYLIVYHLIVHHLIVHQNFVLLSLLYRVISCTNLIYVKFCKGRGLGDV